MTTAGPNSPGTLASDATVGTIAWSNPSNAASQNNTYASATAPGDDSYVSEYLKGTNLGLSIPAGATINGIVAEVDGYCVPDFDNTTDNAVRIVKGGVIGSTNMSKASGPSIGSTYSDSNTYSVYGSSSNLWGTTWTPADINASNFGVAISFNLGRGDEVRIDHVRITVYYTVSGGNPNGGQAMNTSALLHAMGLD